jgi:hypothetical protein
LKSLNNLVISLYCAQPNVQTKTARKNKFAGGISDAASARPAGFESVSNQTNRPAHTQEGPQFNGLARAHLANNQNPPARED